MTQQTGADAARVLLKALTEPDPNPSIAWRDEAIDDLRDLRDRIDKHHTETDDGACVTCSTTWPCPTRRELDKDYLSAWRDPRG